MTAPIPFPTPQAPAIERALSALHSPNSRRAYRGAIARYLARGSGLHRLAIQGYLQSLEESGASPATRNLALAALKALAQAESEAGAISEQEAGRIAGIKAAPNRGVRLGNWLSLEQAKELRDAPPADTLLGLRDRAILACLAGGGLRRDELARLDVGQFAIREGRTCIVDLLGKGGRVRSLALSAPTAERIEAWRVAAGITAGPLIRAMYQGQMLDRGLTADRIHEIVVRWSTAIGCRVAPHDLRRTTAALAAKGGAKTKAVQAMLGHANVATTDRYLSALALLEDPAGDCTGL
jgi:site-specific recombinase XerD